MRILSRPKKNTISSTRKKKKVGLPSGTLIYTGDKLKEKIKIKADLRLSVLNSVNKYGIDICTPSIVKRIESPK